MKRAGWWGREEILHGGDVALGSGWSVRGDTGKITVFWALAGGVIGGGIGASALFLALSGEEPRRGCECTHHRCCHLLPANAKWRRLHPGQGRIVT
jgi:hypothetical protein